MTISPPGKGVSFVDATSIFSGLTAAQIAQIQSQLGIAPVTEPSAAYISGRAYSVSPYDGGGRRSATNANTLTTDTAYGILFTVKQNVTISAMGFLTSGSNASAGAQVKFGVYNVDSATLLPTTFIGGTTAVAVTDAATTTAFSQTMTANQTLTLGNIYLGCILATAATTACRSTTFDATSPWANFSGATSIANLLATNTICGYKSADGAMPFAAGFLASFGTPTAITANVASSSNQTPYLSYLVA